MQKVEYEILDKWFNWMTESNDCTLDIIFYLRTSPDTCYKRLHCRNRPEETSSISMDYLQNLHDLHETWLVKGDERTATSMTKFYRPPAIIVIDANQPLEVVFKSIENETKNAVAISLAI